LNRLSSCFVCLWLVGVAVGACGAPPERSAAAQGSASSASPRAPEAPKSSAPTAPATQGRSCEVEGANVEQELWQTRVAKDAVGALRIAAYHSRMVLPDCPQSEPMWYALIRAAELGVVEFPIDAAGRQIPTALDAAQLAAARCPESVRVKTVLARLEGTEIAARAAIALDNQYAPAALALAASLVASGKAEQAVSTLGASAVRAVPGASTTRSAALLSLGRARMAATFARRELREEGYVSPEPFIAQFVQRDAEEALGRALRADHQTVEARSHLETAGALGSRTARQLLDSDAQQR
jgi:hypothetical protein